MALSDIRFIDMHCDTLLKILEGEKQVDSLYENEWHLDLRRLQAAGCSLQFFAVFIEMCIFAKETAAEEGYKRAHQMIDIFDEACKMYPGILEKVTNYDEMKRANEAGKTAGLITLEEAGILDDRLERIDSLYERGVRLMTLTWNDENCIGYPNSKNPNIMNAGLKKFGIEAVQYMNEKNILVDVSHLSDGGFWDVVKYSKKPFVASHSNCRAVMNHPRNLSDDMLRAIADKGGLVGLNFNPPFLGEGSKGSELETMIVHLKNMEDVAGIETVALGTDYDGIHGKIAVEHVGEMSRLADAMSRAGYSYDKIDKILYGNAARFIKDNL